MNQPLQTQNYNITSYSCKSEPSNLSTIIRHQLCGQCINHQDSVALWMEHLSKAHPIPTEWLSDKAKLLKDEENDRPYTVVTDSRKRRRRPTTPRPLNTFMIFSRHIRRNILAVFPDASNSQVSKELGILWKQMTNETKAHYEEEAKRLQRLHQQEFPDYKYQPKKRNRRDSGRLLYDDTSALQPVNTPGASSSLVNAHNRHTNQSPLSTNQYRQRNLSNATPNSPGADSYSSSSGYGGAAEYSSSYLTKKERNSTGSDVENHYIRYSMLNKNFAKRECQTFNGNTHNNNNNNNNNNSNPKIIFSNTNNTNNVLSSINHNINNNTNPTTLLDTINFSNNNSNNHNTISLIKKENVLEKPFILNTQHNNTFSIASNNNNHNYPLNKQLNVRITNLESRQPQRLAASNLYLISQENATTSHNQNNHSNIILTAATTTPNNTVTQSIITNNTFSSLFNNNSSTTNNIFNRPDKFLSSRSSILPMGNNNSINQLNNINNNQRSVSTTFGAGLDLLTTHIDDVTNIHVTNHTKDICLINGIYPETISMHNNNDNNNESDNDVHVSHLRNNNGDISGHNNHSIDDNNNSSNNDHDNSNPNIDEDIDITSNIFSHDLDVDWSTELDVGFHTDLPNLQSLFHH